MPRITFYISEEDKKEWYEKFKEQMGESASSFFVDSIKRYVLAKEQGLKEMSDIVLPVGQEHIDGETANIKHIKFVGKLIAETTSTLADDTVVHYAAYLTVKGKVLVHTASDHAVEVVEYKYKVHDTQADFFKGNYPSRLINDALKNLPQVEYEELDI